jgi:hypothetical protein
MLINSHVIKITLLIKRTLGFLATEQRSRSFCGPIQSFLMTILLNIKPGIRLKRRF